MAAARRLPEGDRYVRAGRWRTWGPLLLLGRTSTARRSGSSGFGRIGQAVARRARGLRDAVLYHDVQPAAGRGRGGARRDLRADSRSCSRESDFVIAPREPHRRDART